MYAADAAKHFEKGQDFFRAIQGHVPQRLQCTGPAVVIGLVFGTHGRPNRFDERLGLRGGIGLRLEKHSLLHQDQPAGVLEEEILDERHAGRAGSARVSRTVHHSQPPLPGPGEIHRQRRVALANDGAPNRLARRVADLRHYPVFLPHHRPCLARA